MNDKAPLTMKDIARELGISVSTVSRALKDSSRISAERRAMIQQFAREHNFTPNVLAESLRHSKVQPIKIIGVIIPEFTHFYFSSVLAGIEEEASARGYRIMVAQSGENYEREVRICQSFFENKVCGIIVSQAKDTKKYDHFERLMDAGVPLVFYDRICDNRADAEAVTPELLQQETPPDGFFAVNDDTAIGILYTAKRMGFLVPDDISICGFTNGQRAVACDPMLTTVEQRGMKVGEEAVDILIDQVEGIIPREKAERRVVRTRLVVRGTTR